MDSSKLAAVLQKRQSERAQAKQPVAAPVTQVAVVTPVALAYPALRKTLQKRKEEREQATPLNREALTHFMEDQKKAVKYQTSKKDRAPAEDDIDWSFTVPPNRKLPSLRF